MLFLSENKHSHLLPDFLYTVPEKPSCSVGLGMVMPRKVHLDLLLNLAFPLDYSEPTFPHWLSSVLRKSCVLCCIGALLFCLRTCLKRWEWWSLCTAGRGYVRYWAVMGNCCRYEQIDRISKSWFELNFDRMMHSLLPLCVQLWIFLYVCMCVGTYT